MWSKIKSAVKSAAGRVYKTAFSAAAVLAVMQSRAFASAGGGSMDLGAGSGFFTSAIDCLKIVVIAIGIGLGGWGIVNLLEGYGNDNPGAKSQGMKQLMSGAGIAVVGAVLIPKIADLF